MANGDLHAVRDYDNDRLTVTRERTIYGGSGTVTIGGQTFPATHYELAADQVVYDGPITHTFPRNRRDAC